MNNEKFLIFVLVCFIIYSLFKDIWFYKQTKFLRYQVKNLSKKSHHGNFDVFLKEIDERRTIETIDVIKKIKDCKLEEARKIVAITISSEGCILETNINVSWANEIKNLLKNCGAVAIIEEN